MRIASLLMMGALLAGCNEADSQSPIPLTARGSFCGLYEWYGKNEVSLPEPSADTYRRFTWKELEREEGDYDFSPIKRALDAARKQRRKFGFRVMSCWSGEGAVVPDYLVRKMPNGFWFASHGGKNDTYAPDWNSPVYLERARALLAELGGQFDRDQALGWVDIGLYGNWGEWHVAQFPYRDHPNAQPGTDVTKHAIIDAHISAFPHSRLLMMTDDPRSLDYALRKSPDIGMRRDSLGDGWFAEGLESDREVWALASQRWKTAPFVTEFYAPSPSGMFDVARRQVQKYHITLIGNGNTTSKFSELSSSDQTAFRNLHAQAGARIELLKADVRREAKGFRATFSLRNSGNAPVYDEWVVKCLLRSKDGRVLTSRALNLDIRKLLPSEPGTHGECSLDAYESDDAEVVLVAVDPSGYLPNLPIGTIVDPSTRGTVLGGVRR